MPYAVRTMAPEPIAPALAAATAIAARRISVTRPFLGAPGDLGPSAGVSVEPHGDRILSLALSDVIVQMPDGYLKPHESFDTNRRVTLRAAEVEKGLAAGRPSIPIAAIYQQVPEIFLHTVQPSDPAVVVLPAQKVIFELSHLRVREDQTAEPIMAQVETPFLKLMVEESAKFGTKMAPFTTTELPALPIEPLPNAPAAAQPTSLAAVRPPPISQNVCPTADQSHDSTAGYRGGTGPGRLVAFCCTECTAGNKAGKIFANWNGWVRVSASSSLQRAARSSRRTTARCANANPIPNTGAGCAAKNRCANAGARAAGTRGANGCSGCRQTA